ncbi:sulfotransferase domain superfamily [Geminocystis sp. NIES-3708]|uniref:sulfotransferase family protein n=1 Tax=Geminocystis sp. NIES-3708 TaxID=1615909 RepID=UPI0005FC9BE5|nr:sulfotransferase [Geminocystis sp. NIES-3708]BAQ62825.1 sulfotransferase domain superfamily [Geminocystis sp. NIES-3708]
MINKPCFLVGAERSGTTLLRLMLDHHPSIGWVQEFEYSIDLVTDNGQFPSLHQYYEWLETNRIFQSMGFMIDQNLDYPLLINSFLEQKFNSCKKPIIGATVHRHFDRLLYIWHDACFIHLIRDPRDVARSCIAMGWAGNVWYGVDRWLEAESLWDNFKKTITSDRYIEVKYENLITDPITVLSSISQFLGVNYDSLMLAYDQDTTYSSPDPKLIQQWRKKMSDFEIGLVESKIGNLLTNRDYELSGVKSVNPNFLVKKKLKIQNWWAKVKFRINRLGISLFLADFISRKLGLKSWQKQVTLSINEITKKNLK